MRKGFRAVVGCVVAASLSGCVQVGSIAGRLSIPGKPATPVTFAYQSQRFGEGGTISVTLPSGELFNGKYLQVTSTTTADVIEPVFWGPVWDPWGDPWFGGGNDTAFVRNYSGKVVATLFGDKGDTMRCRFNLTNPDVGMGGGGVGECQVSNGTKIDAQF